MPTKSSSRRTTRAAVAAAVIKPEPPWNEARFTVVISFIDPCCPIDDFHTDSLEDAERTFRKWKERVRRSGGEWILQMWEHPKTKNTTRSVMRNEPRGWIYWIEFPRSRSVHRYDYMQASSENAKSYTTPG